VILKRIYAVSTCSYTYTLVFVAFVLLVSECTTQSTGNHALLIGRHIYLSAMSTMADLLLIESACLMFIIIIIIIISLLKQPTNRNR